ncbi:Sip1/TFIP11 interacting protein [Coprinopsis sp. MPI-PUGE-AT-0042]|nr:Sip1/TFIP11 interacting protein [Coprinopsis sp. MPI-PUGE-AT-0042]
MGRRKRGFLDDGDDDSDISDNADLDGDFETNDPDLREERERFENPYGKHKRRRRNGKEDAIYGVFGDDSEDEDAGRGRGPKGKRSDWAKAPAFVSGDKKVDLDASMDVDAEGGEQDEEDESMKDAEQSENNSSSEGEQDEEERIDSDGDQRSPSPKPQAAEEEAPRPKFGGLGFSRQAADDDPPPAAAVLGGIGSSKGGIGSGRGGLGAARGGMGAYASFLNAGSTGTSSFSKGGIGSKPGVEEVEDYEEPPDVPSAFGQSSGRFTRDATPSMAPAKLSADEAVHFSKLQGTFGARMLAKMGWQAGTGLGAGGEGIVTPIESKLRPQKMGIAFKGFKEKTDQSKKEARRRGEAVSEDEEDKTVRKLKKKAREAQEKRAEAWKKPKKVKTKIQHKTYEQILEEAGDQAAPAGVGQIIDATGAVPREVSSLSEVSVNPWGPSSDPTRIPEVRHNIKLIADACKSDLDGLAREAKALQERKKFVVNEDARLRKRVEEEAELIARMQQIQIVANEIQVLSKELSSMYEVILEPFSPLVHKLVDQYANEFELYQLDEVVVAAITPTLRRLVSSWNPLEDPDGFLSVFRDWRRALKISADEPFSTTTVDIYGAKTVVQSTEEKLMTPFESLLWNVWLPKIRTVVNNDWSAEDPQPAVKLYEAWSAFLPRFIRENMLDQLFLPKVQKAVADWNPRRSKVSLHSIVFPWLPHIGLRLDTVLDDARRKVKSVLKSWSVGDSKPGDLQAWKEVFDKGEWDTLMLKYIVPKLGATLRNDFKVNPRAQNMEPLRQVLEWSDLIRPSIFSQIIETEFFPKWLDVLHIWLIQPKVSFEEVAQWYQFWKDVYPEDVRNLSGIGRGFTRGLQLMNKAIELGPDAPTRLPKPDFKAELAAAAAPPPKAKDTHAPARSAPRTQEITFRTIVEEYAAEHNLLFIPTGRAHEKSRMPLYRVSATADGKHGLLVYVLDDAVWAPKPGGVAMENEEFRAVSLDEMVARAQGGV